METMVDVLGRRVSNQPDRLLYSFLRDGENESDRLTFRAVDARARAIAASLMREGLGGERVLLLHLPDLEFISAFFGCLYAGSVAVPLALLDLRRVAKALPTLRSIASDCQPAAVLTSAGLHEVMDDALLQHLPTRPRHVLHTDELMTGSAESWQRPALTSSTVAFLQYTSGSTGTPKGVINTHGNVLANLAAIQAGMCVQEESRVVSWLPFFHDMGLIGHVLVPAHVGCHSVLMPPTAFIAQPVRWLKAISRYRSTISGGPSFAYDLCLRKISLDQLRDVDLSSWSLAYNGSEPIRAGVLDDFARAFAGVGFDRKAFFPCYGMAEATLYVAGGHAARPGYRSLDQLRAAGGSVEPADPLHAKVACGQARPDHRVVIVDPETRMPLPPEQEGEIWFSGPSVAAGYWNKPAETEQQFGASLADGSEGRYLRTGDLGFLQDGQLYVSGRRKELIILRGQNHHPVDLEQTIERAIPELRPRTRVAFTVEKEGQEHLCIMQEAKGTHDDGAQALAARIRSALQHDHDLVVQAIALVPHGTIPKTSSGKLNRNACRQMLLEGTGNAFFLWTDAALAGAIPAATRGLYRASAGSAPAATFEEAFEEVRQLVADFVKREPLPHLTLDTAPIRHLNLDSVAVAELLGQINARFSIQINYRKLFLERPDPDEFTLRDLTALVLEAPATAPLPVPHATPEPGLTSPRLEEEV